MFKLTRAWTVVLRTELTTSAGTIASHTTDLPRPSILQQDRNSTSEAVRGPNLRYGMHSYPSCSYIVFGVGLITLKTKILFGYNFFGSFMVKESKTSNSFGEKSISIKWQYERTKGEFLPVLHWVPHHEDVWKSECIAPCIHNLSNCGFSPGKGASIPLDRRLGVPFPAQPSGCYGEKSLVLPGTEPRFPGHPVIPESLHYMRYHIIKINFWDPEWEFTRN
jgi:hypothetical protein